VTGPRVVVLGAGIVGAACAAALADGGAEVRVLDPGRGRAAASWAAAGILSPSHPDRLPEEVHALGARSLELWPAIGARHPEIELRRIGQVLIGDDPSWLAWRRARGLETTAVGRPPAGPRSRAHLFPEVQVVRAHRVPAALLGGIAVDSGPVPPLAALRGRAEAVVLAAGAWAGGHLAELGLEVGVEPRRGQMLLFRSGRLGTVLIEAEREGVAVPRADGRIVAGTTLEDAGFAARTRAADLDRLERWARARIPGLGPREDSWAGLRPWSPRPVPAIGWAAPGVVAAVGHFRNGVLLAPATGELVADLVLGRPPAVDPAPYAP
jgi:glycine oxidase